MPFPLAKDYLRTVVLLKPYHIQDNEYTSDGISSQEHPKSDAELVDAVRSSLHLLGDFRVCVCFPHKCWHPLSNWEVRGTTLTSILVFTCFGITRKEMIKMLIE